jgi:hypothetical protein
MTINFSMSRASTASWQAAQELASLPTSACNPEIKESDCRTALLGQVICHPPLKVRLLRMAVRVGERGRVGQIFDLL